MRPIRFWLQDTMQKSYSVWFCSILKVKMQENSKSIALLTIICFGSFFSPLRLLLSVTQMSAQKANHLFMFTSYNWSNLWDFIAFLQALHKERETKLKNWRKHANRCSFPYTFISTINGSRFFSSFCACLTKQKDCNYNNADMNTN